MFSSIIKTIMAILVAVLIKDTTVRCVDPTIGYQPKDLEAGFVNSISPIYSSDINHSQKQASDPSQFRSNHNITFQRIKMTSSSYTVAYGCTGFFITLGSYFGIEVMQKQLTYVVISVLCGNVNNYRSLQFTYLLITPYYSGNDYIIPLQHVYQINDTLTSPFNQQISRGEFFNNKILDQDIQYHWSAFTRFDIDIQNNILDLSSELVFQDNNITVIITCPNCNINLLQITYLFFKGNLFQLDKLQSRFQRPDSQINDTSDGKIMVYYTQLEITWKRILYGFNSICFQNNTINFATTLAGTTVPNQIIMQQAQFQNFKFGLIIIYSMECPKGFYYNQIDDTCTLCQDYCLSCNCQECMGNFTKVKLSVSNDYEYECKCQPPKIEVTKICYDFDNSPMKGCISARTLPGISGQIIICEFCSPTDNLVLFQNGCKCKEGYKEKNGVCEHVCGDGIIVKEEECDDMNLESNDGCSSDCTLEVGRKFICRTVQGTTDCEIETEVSFSVSKIYKNENNSALFVFTLKNSSQPFNLSQKDFQSSDNVSVMHTFSVQTSSQQAKYTSLQSYVTKVKGKSIEILVNFDFSIEKYPVMLVLNMSQSRYITKNENLNYVFKAKGDNAPLLYSEYLEEFKTISFGMFFTAVLSLIFLIIGAFSPKFIGLEMNLVLQLIFLSQLMVKDPSQWPVGFVYLKYLKLSMGYNNLFKFTSYFPESSVQTQKLNHLQMSKTIIENYNISFLLLLLVLLAFAFTALCINIYDNKLASIVNEQEEPNKQNEIRQGYMSWLDYNQKGYQLLTQTSYWSVLPIMAAFFSNSLIDGSFLQVLQEDRYQLKVWVAISGLGLLVALHIVVLTAFNKFNNILLDPYTVGKLKERPNQAKYKKACIFHLLLMSFLIFPGNSVQLFYMPCSFYALLVHVAYIILLLKINPYKLSLRIHQIGLILCQLIYLLFLVVLTTINLIEDMSEIIILIWGYILLGSCTVLVGITIVRLYYQYRYGQALQIQIQNDRDEQKRRNLQQEKQAEQNQIDIIEQEARKRIIDTDLKRKRNVYLYDNMKKQEDMNDLIQWIEKRTNWSRQRKQEYYFEHFDEKPMKWLKKHDPEEFAKRKMEEDKVVQAQQQRELKRKKDPRYIEQSSRLRGQLKQLRQLSRMHRVD